MNTVFCRDGNGLSIKLQLGGTPTNNNGRIIAAIFHIDCKGRCTIAADSNGSSLFHMNPPRFEVIIISDAIFSNCIMGQGNRGTIDSDAAAGINSSNRAFYGNRTRCIYSKAAATVRIERVILISPASRISRRIWAIVQGHIACS